MKPAALVAFGCLAGSAAAQDPVLPPPASEPEWNAVREDLRVDYNLWKAQDLAEELGLANPGLVAELKNRRIDLDLVFDSDLGAELPWVRLEVVGPEGATMVPALDALSAVGGDFEGSWESRVYGRVRIDRVRALGSTLLDMLAEEYFVSLPNLVEQDVQAGGPAVGQGPMVTNARDYRVAGMQGAGVTIAVIDSGFAGLAAARANGDAPPAAQTTLDPLGHVGNAAETHGTSCVEILYDFVPAATYRLYPARSLTHFGAAVDDIIGYKTANNVPVIISHSQSWYNTGWRDDSGDVCKAADRAAAADILFITAAGNRARQHFQTAAYVDANGNNWHDFPDGTEDIAAVVPAGQQMTFYLQWDREGDNTNYDLFLHTWNAATNSYVEVARSTTWSFLNIATQDFERIVWTNPAMAAQTVYLGVLRQSGTGALPFEVFGRPFNFTTNIVGDSSTASPANALDARILSVGAIDHRCYTPGGGACPGNAADPLELFSSWGPTNNGVFGVSLCGPDSQTTFTDGANGFAGTSCATPSVAAMMALIRSGKPALAWATIRDQFYDWSRRFRDWPPAGFDRYYGHGGAMLPNVRIDMKDIQLPALNSGRTTIVEVLLLGTNMYLASDIREGAGIRLVYTETYNHIGQARYGDFNGDGFEDARFRFGIPASFPTGRRTFALFGEWSQDYGRGLPWAGVKTVNVTR